MYITDVVPDSDATQLNRNADGVSVTLNPPIVAGLQRADLPLAGI
jgi:hypothetical protein